MGTNRRRGRGELEYERIDTGVFDDDRYFDVFVEYAKASPGDVRIRISAHNRGPKPAELHVLPTLWFRNLWSWHADPGRPTLELAQATDARAVDPALGERYLSCEGTVPFLFTENEMNTQRIFGAPNRSRYVKDGINDHVVHGRAGVVNPAQTGTKTAAHYRLTVGPGECGVVHLRLSNAAPADLALKNGAGGSPFDKEFDDVFAARQNEADEPVQADPPAGPAERPLAPHIQRRRHQYAG